MIRVPRANRVFPFSICQRCSAINTHLRLTAIVSRIERHVATVSICGTGIHRRRNTVVTLATGSTIVIILRGRIVVTLIAWSVWLRRLWDSIVGASIRIVVGHVFFDWWRGTGLVHTTTLVHHSWYFSVLAMWLVWFIYCWVIRHVIHGRSRSRSSWSLVHGKRSLIFAIFVGRIVLLVVHLMSLGIRWLHLRLILRFSTVSRIVATLLIKFVRRDATAWHHGSGIRHSMNGHTVRWILHHGRMLTTRIIGHTVRWILHHGRMLTIAGEVSVIVSRPLLRRTVLVEGRLLIHVLSRLGFSSPSGLLIELLLNGGVNFKPLLTE